MEDKKQVNKDIVIWVNNMEEESKRLMERGEQWQ